VLTGSPKQIPDSCEFAFIHANRNGGYASGNNLGIRLALSLPGTEYIFLLNNDTTIEGVCLSRLVARARSDPKIGIVGSILVEGDGRYRIAGGKYNPLLTVNRLAIAAADSTRVDIDYVSGAALFVRAAVLRQIGLLDEAYFLYFEELDLARRAQAAGYTVTWCPDSIVHHKRGASTHDDSGRTTSTKSFASEYHSNLSCLIFTAKFHPHLLWLAATMRFFLKIAHSIFRLKVILLLPLVLAYRDYFLRLRTRRPC
jgi:GT2 family glycosyltransferase